MQPQSEQLDPSVVALTKAIGHQESGGDYNKVGDNGHSVGAYQWNSKTPVAKGQIPENFKSYASTVGADPDDFSPANQDRVAYKTVESWGKQGLSPAQIASKWNSGDAEKYKTAKPGYNAEQGVKYDVKAYVDNVAKYYDEYNKGGQSQPSASTPTDTNLTKDTIIKTGAPASTPDAHTGAVGTNPGDSTYGKIIDNKITRGIMDVGNVLSLGGAKQLGNEVGSSLATIKEKAKGIFGGEDNSKYVPEGNIGNAIKGATKVVGTVGALAAGGTSAGREAVASLFGRGAALNSPEVTKILQASAEPGQGAGALTRKAAIDRLGAFLENSKLSTAGGKTEQLVLKAIQELNPTLVEKEAIVSKLIKAGWNTAKIYALYKLLGDKAGALASKFIP